VEKSLRRASKRDSEVEKFARVARQSPPACSRSYLKAVGHDQQGSSLYPIDPVSRADPRVKIIFQGFVPVSHSRGASGVAPRREPNDEGPAFGQRKSPHCAEGGAPGKGQNKSAAFLESAPGTPQICAPNHSPVRTGNHTLTREGGKPLWHSLP
jgi:hypothetical protein